MPVRHVKCRSAEFELALFTAQSESLVDCYIFVELSWLTELRDGARQVSVNHVGRLNECVFVEIGTRLRFRVPARIQQWLARNQAAACVSGAEQILPATDSDGSTALIAVDARD